MAGADELHLEDGTYMNRLEFAPVRQLLGLVLGATMIVLLVTAIDLRAPVSGEAVRPTKFVNVSPFRLVDTRAGLGADRIDATTWRVDAAGISGIPHAAEVIAVTIVATGATGDGHLVAYPTGQTRPEATSLSYRIADTTSTGALVQLGSDGSFEIATSGRSNSSWM